MFLNTSDSLGILCRGESLLHLKYFEKYFDKCFIINDFKNEIYHFGDILKNKEIIHFVNRLSTPILKRKTYKEFRIKTIQMSTAFNLFDRVFLKSYLTYNLFFLNVKTMPFSFIKDITIGLNSNYNYKFPNTGILSILFAARYLNIKSLYILGLDFYAADYIFRTIHANPLEIQAKKIINLNLIDLFLNFVKNSTNINFYIKSNYKFNINLKPKNLILL